MDDELRELERRAAAGDVEARAALELRWVRAGLGWWGEQLPAGVSRSQLGGSYRFAADPPFVLSCQRLVDGRVVPTLVATFEMTVGPPPAPFDEREANAVFDAGYRWVLLDMQPCPTTSSRSLGGLIRHAERFRKAGGRLVSYGGPHGFQQVVKLLGLQKVFDWVPERGDALELLGGLDPTA